MGLTMTQTILAAHAGLESVEAGQLIANCGAGLSVPQYASISGKVTFADNTKVVIEA